MDNPSRSLFVYFTLFLSYLLTFVVADIQVEGLHRLAKRASGCCSTYGICSYTSPNADVVVPNLTCDTCWSSCTSNSKCQFAYFDITKNDCYLWYTAFNSASVQDCYNAGSGPYVRVGACTASSSSLSPTSSPVVKTSTATPVSSTKPVSSTRPVSSTIPASSATLASSTKPASSSTVISSSSSTKSSTSSSVASAPSGSYTVAATILVISPDSTSGYYGTSGLNAHGIPYQLVVVPSGGASLPVLSASSTYGNFGGIIIVSEPAGITAAQWTALYNYQTAFGVRMARLSADPSGGVDGSSFGTVEASSVGGCCSGTGEQLIYFSDTSAFPQAGYIAGATRSTQNIWHIPATINNAAIAKQIAGFGPSSDNKFTSNSTAGVINTIGNRQQMVWFIEFPTDWSLTANYLMHAHINWITRSLYVGQRRVLFNTQIDDVFLETGLYSPSGSQFRLRTSDLDAHASWQQNLNSRLPAGSVFKMELGYNGNGNVQWAIQNDTKKLCNPQNYIQYTGQNYVPSDLEWKKPLGSGTSIWPTTPTSFVWSFDCLKQDSLLTWFLTGNNMNIFSHITHTFSHENENNITYSDASHEIKFNQQYLSVVGFANNSDFSAQGLIPPAITGLHNGDALQAWTDAGIKYAVGDSSRPALMNTANEYWPYITNSGTDGFDGFVVIPRWTMPIFFDCDKMACNLKEWVDTSGGTNSQSALFNFLRETWTSSLLSLHQDPFMLHQANLRYGDTQQVTVGPVSGQLSLEMIFTEIVIQELYRLTTWPIITKNHDAVGRAFVNRMTQDLCKPALTYTVNNGNIVGANVVASAGSCSVPIPVTFPVAATASTSYTPEQIGSDPLTLWTTVGSGTSTFTFSKPIPL